MMRSSLRMATLSMSRSTAFRGCAKSVAYPSFRTLESQRRFVRGQNNNNKDLQRQAQDGANQVFAEQKSEFDALTPVTKRYLSRVYGVTASAIATSGAGAAMMLMTPLGAMVSPFAAGLLALVPVITVAMASNQTVRLVAFQSAAGLLGASIAPLVGPAMASGVLIPAAGLTAATYAGFSAAALMAPKGSAVKMQGPLYAGLMGLIGIQLLGLFFPMPFMQQLTLYGGLALFSLMVASDTGAMIERAEQGQTDVIGDAMNSFINAFQIFVRFLQILSPRD